MDNQANTTLYGVRLRTFKGGGDVVLWVDYAW